VLRSYDSRFRPTNRSPEIYLSQEPHNTVVEDVTEVLQVPEEDGSACSNEADGFGVTKSSSFDNSFWNKKAGRSLLVIATPYRHGGHVAKTPKAFLPIIDQLEMLHKKGFVHGDIRAFNTVFGVEEDQGWLIDFDFGGTPGRMYPTGYHWVLPDGIRVGDGVAKASGYRIQSFHDWYALGRLIFEVHVLEPPDGQDEGEENGFGLLHVPGFRLANSLWKTLKRYQLIIKKDQVDSLWKTIKRDPTPEEIVELKALMCCFDEQGWTLCPRMGFNGEVEATGTIATNRGATGSPPEKKRAQVD
jgi:hypothetical protein